MESSTPSSQKSSICTDLETETTEDVLSGYFTMPSTTPASAEQTVEAAQGTPSESRADNQPFPLMNLPLELRTEVYKKHFVMPGTIVKSDDWDDWEWIISVKVHIDCSIHEPSHSRKYPFEQSVLKLFATSKSVYHESAPVFFRYNHFGFDDCSKILSFLTCIGPTPRRNITSISFVYSGKVPAKAIRTLRECVGLRNLTIKLSYATKHLIPYQYYYPNPDIMKARGLTDLVKIRGIEKLEIIDQSTDRFGNMLDNIPTFEEALQVLK